MEKNEEGACVLTRATLQGAGTLCHFPGVFEVEKKNKDTLKGICLGHLWEDSQEWTGGQGGRGAETWCILIVGIVSVVAIQKIELNSCICI